MVEIFYILYLVIFFVAYIWGRSIKENFPLENGFNELVIFITILSLSPIINFIYPDLINNPENTVGIHGTLRSLILFILPAMLGIYFSIRYRYYLKPFLFLTLIPSFPLILQVGGVFGFFVPILIGLYFLFTLE